MMLRETSNTFVCLQRLCNSDFLKVTEYVNTSLHSLLLINQCFFCSKAVRSSNRSAYNLLNRNKLSPNVNIQYIDQITSLVLVKYFILNQKEASYSNVNLHRLCNPDSPKVREHTLPHPSSFIDFLSKSNQTIRKHGPTYIERPCEGLHVERYHTIMQAYIDYVTLILKK